ncbi:hypothetical protein [Winogradskyella sp.]
MFKVTHELNIKEKISMYADGKGSMAMSQVHQYLANLKTATVES